MLLECQNSLIQVTSNVARLIKMLPKCQKMFPKKDRVAVMTKMLSKMIQIMTFLSKMLPNVIKNVAQMIKMLPKK